MYIHTHTLICERHKMLVALPEGPDPTQTPPRPASIILSCSLVVEWLGMTLPAQIKSEWSCISIPT